MPSLNHIFKDIINSIKNEDSEKLSQLMSAVSSEPNLVKLTDENGDNILHALFRKGSNELAAIVFQNYYKNAQGFYPAVSVLNHAKQSPLDCLNELPNSDTAIEFKSKVKSRFLNFSQNRLRQFFIKYLEMQRISNPNEYRDDDVLNILKDAEGFCFGLSSTWAQYCLAGKQEEYNRLLENIIFWDLSIENLTEQSITSFEKIISMARGHQSLPYEIKEQKSKDIDNLDKLGLFKTNTHLHNAPDFDFEQQQNIPVKNDSNFIFEIEKNWGVQNYQCEAFIKSELLSDLNELCEYTNTLFTNLLEHSENDEKVFIMILPDHAIGCFIEDKNIYFYDPNDPGYSLNGNFSPAYIISRNDETCIKQIVDYVTKSAFDRLGRVLDEWGTSIHIYAMSKKGNPPGSYPENSMSSRFQP